MQFLMGGRRNTPLMTTVGSPMPWRQPIMKRISTCSRSGIRQGTRPTLRQADRTTGQIYYGRGFVQLTWERNYKTMTDLLGVDFVNHPDLALELDNATNIMFMGMTKGLFTGKSLANYFNQTTEDWVNARKIINGLDKAQAIAMYGHNFYSAISYTT